MIKVGSLASYLSGKNVVMCASVTQKEKILKLKKTNWNFMFNSCKNEKFDSVCVSVCAECDCVNGVCNKGPDGDGQCLCQPPYTGKRCDQGKTMYEIT